MPVVKMVKDRARRGPKSIATAYCRYRSLTVDGGPLFQNPAESRRSDAVTMTCMSSQLSQAAALKLWHRNWIERAERHGAEICW